MTIFSSHRIILPMLILVSVIAYGQLLKMNFWQDDNALVFKFTHINEEAGYLGKGIFGEGPYRYTITPYLPIFYFFGYQPQPYFALALVFYLISVISVYFFFRFLFEDKQSAATAGLLYAGGYIASDGFIRLFNSILASTALILTCLTIGFYIKFFRQRKLKWFFLSLASYLLTIQVGYIRAHYLIVVIITLEFLFNLNLIKDSSQKILKKISVRLLRLTPFLVVFYLWFLSNPDVRSGQVKTLFIAITRGKLYNFYSFFSTLGNILFPNEIFNRIYPLVPPFLLTENKVVFLSSFLILLTTFLLNRFKLFSFKTSLFNGLIFLFVLYFSKKIFSYPGLIGGLSEKIALYIGIIFYISCLTLIFALPKKRLMILFIIWFTANLAAYASYIPIYSYPSDNRYLLHSFLPLIGLFTLYFQYFWQKRKISKMFFLPVILISFWGIANLMSSVLSEHQIVVHRAEPSKRFFSQLKSYYPTIEKNSIFYFYIPDKPYAQDHFNNAFSVAQMPEETAIAWRYGIDRYDLIMTTSFSDLEKNIKEKNIPVNKIYAFIADPDQLFNVTDQTRDLLQRGFIKNVKQEYIIESKLLRSGDGTQVEMPGLIIPTPQVFNLTPVKLKILARAFPIDPTEADFPLRVRNSPETIKNLTLLNHYLDYRSWQDYFYHNASVSATSSWKNFLPGNLIDKDPSSYWEADRILWDNHNQGFTVDLKKQILVGGLVYKNGPPSLVPTQFEIQLSQDGNNFITTKNINADVSFKNSTQKITFPAIKARFVRILFHQTQYGDSPGVAKVEILPSQYNDIDPSLSEKFFRSPFSKVSSLDQWNFLLQSFRENGLVEVSWQNDSISKFLNNYRSTTSFIYDNNIHEYQVEIPAGESKLKNLKITPLTIPGIIKIFQITYENSPMFR